MLRTALYERHLALGARLVEFGGWEMPLHYPTGIVEEHLATRRAAGLFDVSHMGRFRLRGSGALGLLQHALTNNAAGLAPGQAQYTMIPDQGGGARDDAYLYCLASEDYLLVVNAANREADWKYLRKLLGTFPGAQLSEATEELAMLSLQGPRSRQLLLELAGEEALPEPGRNNLLALGPRRLGALGPDSVVARTGYTGEALGFELFVPAAEAGSLWDRLLGAGAVPVGLGARDTLRLEAGLPLYGHELGLDPAGEPIPIFACPLARFAVSFSPLKGTFVGRRALARQLEAFQGMLRGDYSRLTDLPRRVRSLVLLDPGVARQGCTVSWNGRPAGWVTSGTVASYWIFSELGASGQPTERSERRAIALALLANDIPDQAAVRVNIRGRSAEALVVPWLIRSEAPPYTRPILWARPGAAPGPARAPSDRPLAALRLLEEAAGNTRWRQRECFNLIPSEMSLSPAARLLSVMDPAFRYAEHRKVRALAETEVFYYQGTAFIEEVERRLVGELASFLGCRRVEPRMLSGQMANMVAFSALVDYLNREDRRREPRRIRSVLNHHILKGGHLSAQPMGALRDFLARDPASEAPAAVPFPVLPEDPYRIDLSRVGGLLERHRPELVVLGKSLILYREPAAELRRLIDGLGLDTVLLYDMAHVLGLVGPHFQEPFAEGVDLVTGSTHKTFFGAQRGVVAADWEEAHPRYPLWEAVERRTFPGSVSNHHLGTLLGLLLAAYEMNHFKDAYQQAVLANAKALARALREEGMEVAGDPAIGYTETHQVLLPVGYGRGVEAARNLEASNIIVNFQATPREEGFTAAGALRLGVAEMTRFGMKEADFRPLAHLIRQVVAEGKEVREEVIRLRAGFLELGFCFCGQEFEQRLQEIARLI
jgi:aminomethyltransferase